MIEPAQPLQPMQPAEITRRLNVLDSMISGDEGGTELGALRLQAGATILLAHAVMALAGVQNSLNAAIQKVQSAKILRPGD